MSDEDQAELLELIETAVDGGGGGVDTWLEVVALLSPFLALLGVALGWSLQRFGQRRDRQRDAAQADLKAAMGSLSSTFRRLQELSVLAAMPASEKKTQAFERAQDDVAGLAIALELVDDDGLRTKMWAHCEKLLKWSVDMGLTAPSGDPDEWGKEWATRFLVLATEYNEIMGALGSSLRRNR